MKKKTWLFFGIPFLAASILIGTGFAAWNFSDGTDNNRRDMEVNVTDVDNKEIERAYYWFGNSNFATAFPQASETDDKNNISTKSPSKIEVTQYNIYIASPLRVRTYLSDGVFAPYNLRFTFDINTAFDKYFDIFVQTTDGMTYDGHDEVTASKADKDVVTEAGTNKKYIEWDPFYIVGAYKQGMIPQTEAAMNEVIGIINNNDDSVKTLLTIQISSSFGTTKR